MINLNIGTEMSEEATKLVMGRVSTAIYRFLRKNVQRTSVMREANQSNIVFPLIASADISNDAVTDYAKFLEVRMAYAVKQILEKNISCNAASLTFEELLDGIPFENMLRKDGFDFSKDIDFEVEIFEECMSAMQDMINMEGMDTGNSFLSDFNISVKTYAEAPLVITDRNAVPTAIEVAAKYVNGRQEIKDVTWTFTVECIARKVDQEILKDKFKIYDNKRFYKRYAQLTKKEIAFVKDLMFDFDLVKKEAGMAVKGKNIFSIIEKNRRLADMGVNIFPFTALMVSGNVADDLETYDRVDIRKEYPMFMKKFFATSMAIYDLNTNVIDIAFDGDKVMASHTFEDVAMDTSKLMKELKNVVRMQR